MSDDNKLGNGGWCNFAKHLLSFNVLLLRAGTCIKLSLVTETFDYLYIEFSHCCSSVAQDHKIYVPKLRFLNEAKKAKPVIHKEQSINRVIPLWPRRSERIRQDLVR